MKPLSLSQMANYADERGRREVIATQGPEAVVKVAAVTDDVPLIEESLRCLASLAFTEADSRQAVRRAKAPQLVENLLLRFPTEPRIQEMGRVLLSRVAS